jgi:hypothetical protein
MHLSVACSFTVTSLIYNVAIYTTDPQVTTQVLVVSYLNKFYLLTEVGV